MGLKRSAAACLSLRVSLCSPSLFSCAHALDDVHLAPGAQLLYLWMQLSPRARVPSTPHPLLVLSLSHRVRLTPRQLDPPLDHRLNANVARVYCAFRSAIHSDSTNEALRVEDSDALRLHLAQLSCVSHSRSTGPTPSSSHSHRPTHLRAVGSSVSPSIDSQSIQLIACPASKP